jgi:hypothetical protein
LNGEYMPTRGALTAISGAGVAAAAVANWMPSSLATLSSEALCALTTTTREPGPSIASFAPSFNSRFIAFAASGPR